MTDFLHLQLGDVVNIEDAKKAGLFTLYSPDGDGETVVQVRLGKNQTAYDLYLIDFPGGDKWHIIYVFDQELPIVLSPCHPNDCLSVLIPESGNDQDEVRIRYAIGLDEVQGYYYSVRALLKKYKDNPTTIDFIADML